ncbi:MAG TPA: response regulator transcription factor [Verrucomicrobiae bacterium]|nr:response regulator transcription factor [Verrucomicrobiae bacterium]
MSVTELKRNILVVDDEAQITRVLKTTLTARGYGIRTAGDGEQALLEMKTWVPDLLITDLRMPHMDGLELCRKVRAQSRIPIIVLSVKGEEAIKVEALDAGADDYVTKPFSVNELLARVRAALRRTSSDEQSEIPVIEIGDFRIDVPGRKVEVRGREVHLTPKEFDVLIYLARHPERVVTHRALLAAVWGPSSVEQPEYLRVCVGHLRKKLEADETVPRYILTEPWIGYRFEPGEVAEKDTGRT